MAIEINPTDLFLQALKNIEKLLLTLKFKQDSFEKRGFAYFIQFRKEDCVVEFLYGPPQYDIDMIVYTPKGKFAFKDLLQIPAIASWVNNNRYKQEIGRNVIAEMLWFVDLLRISLPFIE